MATSKIIDPSKVARVTKQRQFNKAMISESTELINLDEARVELMDIDDWKIITQGLFDYVFIASTYIPMNMNKWVILDIVYCQAP